ncbi:hypothetical protein [Roseobacter sp. TSBP12]|uniref:hypothetical protein n=1 Tax=Roseobacter sp. TSBP12 TaxID=1236613 RepID=UPI00125F8357|nr:hypothetical protein [Roseobacter sp. TSBP12]KAB6714290.1 hypothetical protein C8029_21360 [Roseobacter sp. TSBP12]
MKHEILTRTFVVQHNPNCPSPWLVRIPGKSCIIDMKPYCGFGIAHEELTGDILGFGKTFWEAADAAISQDTKQKVGA